ncbi:MAG: sigma-70 family RNA polymerase sigma factor [Planctomycetota bacterium]
MGKEPPGSDGAERFRDAGSRTGESAVTSLLGRALEGDRAAFATLIRVFRPEVQSLSQRLIGNHEDAEDVAQETFVRAWSGLARLAASKNDLEAAASALAPWLFGIAVHLSRDLLRRRTRAPRREAAARAQDLVQRVTAARHSEPEAQETTREIQALIEAALAALPERLRTALVLRAYEGLSYDSIAEIAGIRPATARTHVAQARRALRRILGPALIAEDDFFKGPEHDSRRGGEEQ